MNDDELEGFEKCTNANTEPFEFISDRGYQPVSESYEKRLHDPEMHCIDVIMSAFTRHLLGNDDGIEAAKRVIDYVSARLDSYGKAK